MTDEEITRHYEEWGMMTQDEQTIKELRRQLKWWKTAFWHLSSVATGFLIGAVIGMLTR